MQPPSCSKSHRRGHSSHEPSHLSGQEPCLHGDPLAEPACPVPSRAPGALTSRKCKYNKYNGKGKTSAGSAQHSTARPQETRFLPGKPFSPRFHSEDVDPMLARGEQQPGAVGSAQEAACSWAHIPAISLTSVCIYMYISFFLIYIYLSLSCSPSNRGRANSQARGLDGRACLRGAGCPFARWASRHPKARLNRALTPKRIIFPSLCFTAVP